MIKMVNSKQTPKTIQGHFEQATLVDSAKARHMAVLTLSRHLVVPNSSARRVDRITIKDTDSAKWFRTKTFLNAHALPAKLSCARHNSLGQS